MSIDERTWRDVRQALTRNGAQTPPLDRITGRATRLRLRRVATVSLIVGVLGSGVVVPLGALTGVGKHSAPATDVAPPASITFVDADDDVRITAPADWRFVEAPRVFGRTPLFSVASSDHVGDGDGCRFSAREGAIVAIVDWTDAPGRILDAFGPRPEGFHLESMSPVEPDGGCPGRSSVMSFHDTGRRFVLEVVRGSSADPDLDRQVEAVLDSLEIGPEAPEPLPVGPYGNGSVLASGHAFGKIWALLLKEEEGGGPCLELTGAFGCTSLVPPDGSLGAVFTGGSTEPDGNERGFIVPLVSDAVATVQIDLSDGRTLSTAVMVPEGIPTPVAIFPVQGPDALSSLREVRAYDAGGRLLGTQTFREGSASATAVAQPILTGNHRDLGDRYTIEVPPGWAIQEDPVPNLVSPRILFGLGSYPFPTGGECGPVPALNGLPPDGAFIWLTEYGGYPGQDGDQDFQPRPRRFRLSGQEPATYECSAAAPSRAFWFRDAGREFQLHVALGPRASPLLIEKVERVLDSFEPEPRS